PECALAMDTAEAKVLDLQELFDPVLRAFTAQAGLLYAPEGGHFGGDQAGVDADNAGFESFGDPPDAGDVASVEVGGQAEFSVVGQGDGFRFALETEQRRHGPEGLFASEGHFRGDVGEDGGLIEAAAKRVAFAAEQYFGTPGLRIANMVFHFPKG